MRDTLEPKPDTPHDGLLPPRLWITTPDPGFIIEGRGASPYLVELATLRIDHRAASVGGVGVTVQQANETEIIQRAVRGSLGLCPHPRPDRAGRDRPRRD